MTFTWIVEAAWSADLTADPSTWSWTDISQYVIGQVQVARGIPNGSAESQPTRCTMRLNNSDSRFTPRHPLGAYYPGVTLGTPIRVRLSSPASIRFQGYIDSISPKWPTGRVAYSQVDLTASGILQRLGHGRPLLSAMRRTITSSQPTAYWPLEDGASATQAASPIAGVSPLTRASGSVRFANTTGPSGSASLADFSAGGSLQAPVPAGTSTTAWRVEFVTKFNTITAPDFVAVLQWTTLGGIALWEIDATDLADGGLYIQYIDSAGSPGGPFVSNKAVDDGNWHHIRIDASQSGGNIALTVKLDNATVITQTISTKTMGRVTTVRINPTNEVNTEVPSLGHLAVWAPYNPPVTTDTYAAFLGNAGETAGTRIARLCAEQGVTATVSGGPEPMGPQSVTRLIDQLRECEAADVAILSDGFGAGIAFLGRDYRANLTTAMTLDMSQRQVMLPFEPVEDDQRLVTNAEAVRKGGSSASYSDSASLVSKGDYQGQTTINVNSDNVLVDHASWLVHAGTVDEMRSPTIRLQLAAHSDLIASWVAMDLGSRFVVTNLPSQYPPGNLDLVLEYYTETFDQKYWQVDIQSAPFATWRVITLATTTGDTGEFVGRLDTEDSALNASITTTATSFAVKTNTGPLWTTASDDMPFDIDVEGERITVTNVTGASSPQTFTVTRSTNGAVKAHGANAVVSLWAPLVLSL